MKNYNWDEESGTLQVSPIFGKSQVQVENAINAGKPNIDGFIAAHLPTLDPNHTIADDWYDQQLLVETLDPEEEREPILDEDGEQTGLSPNAHDRAVESRSDLEGANPWLGSYRGITDASRPDFTMSIEDWKANNASVYNKHLKAQGIEVNGVSISLNESNQHGLADVSVMIDKAISLGTDPFPLNLNMESSTGTSVLTVTNQTEFDTVFLTFGLARQQFFA